MANPTTAADATARDTGSEASSPILSKEWFLLDSSRTGEILRATLARNTPSRLRAFA